MTVKELIDNFDKIDVVSLNNNKELFYIRTICDKNGNTYASIEIL